MGIHEPFQHVSEIGSVLRPILVIEDDRRVEERVGHENLDVTPADTSKQVDTRMVSGIRYTPLTLLPPNYGRCVRPYTSVANDAGTSTSAAR
jgi:hypothetical protein